MSRRRRIASVPLALALALGAGALAAAGPAQADSGERPAGTVVKLPVTSYSQMVVDEAHQRVFITQSQNSGDRFDKFFVYDFRGELVKSIDHPSANAMVLGEDGKSLYVADNGGVYEYDTETLTRKLKNSFQYGSSVSCDRQFAFSGNKLWYTHSLYGGCTGGTGYELWNVTGPANNETRTHDFLYAMPGPWHLAASPELPGRMILGTEAVPAYRNPGLYVLDTSGEKIKIAGERYFAPRESSAAGLDLKDMAFTPDGTRLAVADGNGGHRLLNTSDLSDAPVGYQPPADGAVPTAVAFSSDGRLVARGSAAPGSGADIVVQNADPATGTQQRAYVLDQAGQGDQVARRGLAWGDKSNTLFAVTTNAEHSGYWLHILPDPKPLYEARFAGRLGTDPGRPVVGGRLKINGRLELDGPAPAEPAKVTAVREDADGKRTLEAATVAKDGTFTVEDTPSRTGRATYTVSYGGDATHRPAQDTTLTAEIAKAGTAVTLAAPERARIGHELDFTGKLTTDGARIPSGALVTVTRKTALGTKTLGTAPVSADGTFHITDTPWTAGSTTYTVTWNGDDLHDPSTASATVRIGLRD
ncbi:Ig-like domain repeat protein [Streptomyces sp. URMC 127]|uniref:Ig-like domain-containing protein n=1 Tax=Streptomyces sp. URMC 127 TaxID=3423402 RepID=UPI003F1B8009